MAPRLVNAAWSFTATLGLAALAVQAPARAQRTLEPELPMDLEAPFSLTVNHVPKGDVIILLRDGEPYADPEDLKTAGIAPFVGGEMIEVEGRTLLRLASVSPPLRYELDERAIALHLFVPADMLPHALIDLAQRPPELVYRADTSAFLNYAPRLTSEGYATLYEETGLSVDGNLLFSSAYFSSQHHPVRGMTNLVHDDRDGLLRYTFGDALVRTGALGAGAFVGGITIERTYELDPYAVRTPSFGLKGSTPTPATLDVIVNGARVHSEEIAPGTFDLTNVRVGAGAGQAGYVIRDVFGEEHEIVSPYYVSTETLRAGYEEHAYSLGLRREAVLTDSWGYHDAVALGRHRWGVTDALTLGARGELLGDRFSGGPSIALSLGVGQIGVDLAGSKDRRGGHGIAGLVGYSFTSRDFGANLSLQLMSNRYSTVELGPEDDRRIADAGAQVTVPLGRHITASIRGGIDHSRDLGLGTLVNGQLSLRITNELNWSALGTHTTREGDESRWEVLTTLTYAFLGGYTAQASGRTGTQGELARISTSKSLPSAQGFGYRASSTLSEQLSAEGQVQYQSTAGRYGASYAMRPGADQVSADAAGALVVVPGAGIYPTLPVRGAFGLIRVPGIAGVRGYGNHQELGVTDRKGNILVPNLQPYYGNHLSIAPEDVPIEYQLAATEAVVAPPPRGVAIALFAATRPHFYRGRFVVHRGKARIAPEYGQARIPHADTEIVSPLGADGEFELVDVAPGSHSVIIEWKDGACTAEVKFHDSTETVIELGDVGCDMPSPAKADAGVDDSAP